MRDLISAVIPIHLGPGKIHHIFFYEQMDELWSYLLHEDQLIGVTKKDGATSCDKFSAVECLIAGYACCQIINLSHFDRRLHVSSKIFWMSFSIIVYLKDLKKIRLVPCGVTLY